MEIQDTIPLSGLDSFIFGAVTLIFLSMAGFGWYASYRQKMGKPIKGVTIKDTDAWVGCQGQGLRLAITKVGDDIRVRWAKSNYFIMIGLLGLFGPGVTLLFVLFPEKISHGVPLPVWCMVGLLVLLSFVMFAHQLKKFWFEEPSFDVTLEGILLKKGGVEVQRVRVREIRNLAIEKTSFRSSSSKGRSSRLIENFTLVCVMENGGKHRLCITDYAPQVITLKMDMEKRLQLTVEVESPPSDEGTPPLQWTLHSPH
jgi:hypothetical protein